MRCSSCGFDNPDGGKFCGGCGIKLSVDAYERGERERQLLRLLVRGEQEIAAGMGHDLDEVLAEADTVLADGAA